MTPPLPTRIDRYQVVNRLGRGGMGEVYLAIDPALGRTVAIKMLTEDNEELRERFAREARSAAALNHNNIVTIYDVGEDNGRPFIAMEYLDGETMAEMIKRRAPVPTARKLDLMIELCAGLGYAHRSGIVHRDIKPANLMITADGTLKILDFGIARVKEDATSSGLTRVGMVIGSTHYMSPEQAEGLPVDERSDIFSVGSVFYELLTGERAFAGDNAQVVLNKILNRDPRPIRELRPDLDPELEQIVNRGLTKDLAARYQTLAAMATDVGRVRDRHKDFGEGTVRIERSSVAATGSEAQTHTPTPVFRGALDSKEIARRRAAQIELHLNEASGHFKAGRFEQAIELSEKALVINPEEARALQILQLTHRALEARQVRQWLDEAEALKADGSLTGAERLIAQSLQLHPDSLDAQASLLDLKERRRERERAAERAHAVRAAVAAGRRSLEAGAFEAAARSAQEALAFDAEDQDAKQLLAQARSAIEEHNRREGHDRRADQVVADARTRFRRGDREAALTSLAAFEPAHPRVEEAYDELAREHQTLLAAEHARAQRTALREAHENRARLALAERRWDDARQAISEIGGVAPLDTDWRARVADLTERLAEEEEAQREATRVREPVKEGPREQEETFVLSRGPDTATEVIPSKIVSGGEPSPGPVPARRSGLILVAAALFVAAVASIAYVWFPDRHELPGNPPETPIEVRVRTVVESAESLWAQGKQQEAIDLLQAFQPAHSAVNAVLERFRANSLPTSGGPDDADGPKRRAEARLNELIGQSERALAEGRLDEALARANDAAGLGANPSKASAAVSAVIDAAARRAKAAHDAAAKAGASGEPAFKTAQAADAEGRKVGASNPSAAVRRYLEAERGYQRAEGDYRKALTNQNTTDPRLAEWVNNKQAEARQFASQGRFADEARTYREIRERVPLTAGIDGLIAEAERRRDAKELELWVVRQKDEVEQAIGRRQWDEADRVLAALRERASSTPGLDDLKRRIERGRAEATKKPEGPGKNSPPPTNETAAVEDVVRAYGKAHTDKSVDGMKRFWPAMPARDAQAYRAAFQDHTRLDWQLVDTVSVEIKGATATATCRVRLLIQSVRDSKPRPEDRVYTITLQRNADGWEIIRMDWRAAR